MSSDSFAFKRFTIRQDRCGMKVGMDGVTLGAWALCGNPSGRILDIGCGTGIISLMMAQRYPSASILGIDIDEEAVAQARENVAGSTFAGNIIIRNIALQQLEEPSFDLIVSNPPYFTNSLKASGIQRIQARHNDSLPFRDLIRCSYRLLSDDGTLSLILPAEAKSDIDAEAIAVGFAPSRICRLKTSEKKPPKRVLLEYSKQYTSEIEDSVLSLDSQEYRDLTCDFYL